MVEDGFADVVAVAAVVEMHVQIAQRVGSAAGADQPEAAIQTFLWASKHGETNLVGNLLRWQRDAAARLAIAQGSSAWLPIRPALRFCLRPLPGRGAWAAGARAGPSRPLTKCALSTTMISTLG